MGKECATNPSSSLLQSHIHRCFEDKSKFSSSISSITGIPTDTGLSSSSSNSKPLFCNTCGGAKGAVEEPITIPLGLLEGTNFFLFLQASASIPFPLLATDGLGVDIHLPKNSSNILQGHHPLLHIWEDIEAVAGGSIEVTLISSATPISSIYCSREGRTS